LKELLLDSSFLLRIAEEPTDWENQVDQLFGQYMAVILSSVESELKSIASGKGKRAKMAKVALEISSRFPVVERNGPVDKTILDFASERDAVVATSDAELASSLLERGIKVISLRNRRIFVVSKRVKKR
jgi:rRNA-processing protein FCF1